MLAGFLKDDFFEISARYINDPRVTPTRDTRKIGEGKKKTQEINAIFDLFFSDMAVGRL